jgi:uncharacterized membrane protein YjjB (DUF3815 family)
MPPEVRRSVGTFLIWLGVLAWAPFFALLANGQPVSIVPFLAAHLTGVLGGAWLRSSADKQEGLNKAEHGRRRRIVSRVMIYLGVLAWAPYSYLEQALGQDVEVAPFLAAHLTGVLGGAMVRASIEVERFLSRK